MPQTLLTAGADKHLVDDAGNTACDYAAEGVLEEGAAERNINHDIQALLGSCAEPSDDSNTGDDSNGGPVPAFGGPVPAFGGFLR